MNDDDLARRLRDWARWKDYAGDDALALTQAADRIEQLQADNARLTAALAAAEKVCRVADIMTPEAIRAYRGWQDAHARLTQTGTDPT